LVFGLWSFAGVLAIIPAISYFRQKFLLRSKLNPVCIFILLFFLQGVQAFSETYFEEKKYDPDSLKRILVTATGAERVKTLCILAEQYRIDEADSSIVYAEEAYRLSRSTDDPELDLLATYTIGLAYHHKGDYPKAIRYSLDTKEMALAKNDTMMFYKVMHCVALSYLYSNNPDLFISTLHEALNYLASWKDPARQFELQISLGWSFMRIERYREAISGFLRAAACADTATSISPDRVALNYAHLARCYLSIASYDSAKIIIDKVEMFCLQHGLDLADYVLSGKSDYFMYTKAYDSALIYFKRKTDIAINEGRIFGQAVDYVKMATIYLTLGDTNHAVSLLKNAVEKAEWVCENKSDYLEYDKSVNDSFVPEQNVPDFYEKGGLRWLIRAHTSLYEIYKSKGDTKNALVHLEELNKANDRLRELDRKKDVMEVNTRYETERKEQKIQLLTSENRLKDLQLEQTRYFLSALAGFILLAILVVILLIRQNRMRAMQDKTILEQRLLRAQMNPHFLFNTLTNIQGYMIENDVTRASQYLSRFARLMRNILDNTARESVPLGQEISTIENYLELQKLRYQGKFDYEIIIDENIDTESVFIPPMLAQPFIENAIEHGIRHARVKGKITVQLLNCSIVKLLNSHTGSLRDKMIEILITDNGVGREQAGQIEHKQSKDHRPMATSITRERLQVLARRVNRKLRKKISLEITDMHDEEGKSCGTKVRLVVPTADR